MTTTSFLTEEMTGAMTTAFTAIGNDVVSVVKIGLPIALGVAGLFMAIRLGIAFFKSVAN